MIWVKWAAPVFSWHEERGEAGLAQMRSIVVGSVDVLRRMCGLIAGNNNAKSSNWPSPDALDAVTAHIDATKKDGDDAVPCVTRTGWVLDES